MWVFTQMTEAGYKPTELQNIDIPQVTQVKSIDYVNDLVIMF